MSDGEDPKGYATAASDDEQAEWLAVAFDHQIRYDHTAKRWHRWNGIRWAPDGTQQVQRETMDHATAMMQQVLGKNLSEDEEKRRLAIYRSLRQMVKCNLALDALATRPDYKTDGADWDQNPYFLGCENGVLDLRYNALVDKPGPEMLVTKTTGHSFTPLSGPEEFEARAPRFFSFLGEITSGDWELAGFYLAWFAYSLFGLNTEQRFLILTGIGRNGKGALVHAMQHVAGDYNAKVDQAMYMHHKFGSSRSDSARADLMELKGKRLAVMSEPDGGRFNEELLKAHTGGDRITARALYSNNVITWYPTHSITFLTNKPPAVNDIGPSMAARVMVADFRERYEGDNEDKGLYTKLEEEAEGILAILAWYAKAWYEAEGGISLPERVRKASEAYMRSNDPIGQVLEEAFVVAHDAKAFGRAIYEIYLEWHAHSDDAEPAMSMNGLSTALLQRGFTKKQVVQGTVWLGLRPKTALEVADDDAD